MIRLILIIAIFFGLYSCKTKESTKSSIQFQNLKQCKMSEVIDSVSYIPINLSSKVYFSQVSKLIVNDVYILLGDYVNDKIIVLDRSANYLYEIDRKGRSSHEYLELKCFCADDRYIYIVDNYKRRLLMYSIENGDYIKSLAMPIVAWDIECVGDNKFAFAFSSLNNDDTNTHRLYITNRELNILQKEFPYTKFKRDPIGKDRYFTRTTKGDVVFHWCGSDTYYVIGDAKGEITIDPNSLDFGANSITDNVYEDFATINKQKMNYMYSTPIVSSKYTLFDIITHTYDGNFVYENGGNNIFVNNENDSMYMPFPISMMGEYYIFILESYDDYMWLKSIGYPAASNEIENHIKDDNPIIVRYKLKLDKMH